MSENFIKVPKPYSLGIIPRGGTPYNGLYGEAPPERGIFFRLQVYKGVGISQVGRKISIRVLKRALN